MVAEGSTGVASAHPRICVIVPCHNDGAFVGGTIASIRETESVEVVIVDDGSVDPETTRAMDRLEGEGYTVIRHDQNRGVSATRMTALAATSAPYVFPLDADDLLLAGTLGAMADRIQETGADVCCGDFVELWPGDRIILRAVPQRLDLYRLAWRNDFPPSVMFRRTALESARGWQPIGATIDARSDWSLWMTLASSGARLTHLGVGEATYVRRMHPGRISSAARGRNRELSRAMRQAHPEIFGRLAEHRRASSLSRWKRRAYPAVYGLRVPGLDWRVKAALDRIGVGTMQRPLDRGTRTSMLESIDEARLEGARLMGHQEDRKRGSHPARPPVIVIGSGRSGTVYVSTVLDRLGVFMGASQDPNAEAYHFIRLNTALLARAGVAWNNPEALRTLLEDSDRRARARAYVESRLRAPFGASYLGWRELLRSRSLLRYDRPWGWKDPRNTFTLPLWLDVFPDAKVVHVLRHGADVADSIWRKQGQARAGFLAAAAANRRFHLPTIAREVRIWLRTRSQFPRVRRFQSVDDCLAVWDTYVTQAKDEVASLPGRSIEIRFEDLVTDPEPQIRRLASFCELPAPDAVVAELTAAADSSRAFAYRGRPDLVALAERSADVLATHGYAPGGRAEAPPAAEGRGPVT